MEEYFKDIPGYEGYYQASNYGRIKSLARIIKGKANGTRVLKEKILKPDRYKKTQYQAVRLSRNGETKHMLVSHLIYLTFKGPIPSGMIVNHINEDPTDNRPENLNVMFQKDNLNWGTRNKRIGQKLKNNRVCSKEIIQYSLDGSFISKWPSQKEILRVLGFANSNISACCKGKLKTAYGFIWRIA